MRPLFVVGFLFVFLKLGVTNQNENCKNGPLSVLLLHSMFPSHYYPLISLGAELVSRGHKVTSLGVNIEGYENLPEMIKSYGIHYIEGTTLKKDIYTSYIKDTQGTNISGDIFSIASDIAKGVIKEREYLQALVKTVDVKLNQSHYDYIIGEQATIGLLYYMHKKWETNNIMLILLILGATPPYTIPWTYPLPFTPFTDNMSFLDRFMNTVLYKPLQSIAVEIGIRAIYPRTEFSPLSDPILHLIYQPTIYTTVIGVERAVSRLPTQHYIGPMLLPNRPPLPEDLLSWINNNEPHLPLIYVSTGTLTRMSTDITDIILSLTQHYRLVWVRTDNVSEESKSPHKTNRIYVTQWIEQRSLLQNPSVQLVIFHCGVNSVHEALYYGIPVLCIPQGGDQYNNGFRIQSQGLGISIRPNELTIDKLHTSVDDLLNKQEYKRNLFRVKRLLREGGGAKKGADLVELYASVGYDHTLPSFIRNQWSAIQFYNIDVWIVLVGVVMAIIWVCYHFTCCFRKQKRKIQ